MHSSKLLAYNDAGDEIWNRWSYRSPAPAAVESNELEVIIPSNNVEYDPDAVFDVLFHTKSWDDFQDFSDTVITTDAGVLSMVQQATAPAIAAGQDNRMLSLNLEALGGGMTVSTITLTLQGDAQASDISGITLTDGATDYLGTLQGRDVSFALNRPMAENQTLDLDLTKDEADWLLRHGCSKPRAAAKPEAAAPTVPRRRSSR